MFKNIGQWAILLLIVAGIVVILFIGCAAMGIVIPAWVQQVGWVLVIVCVCIGAIKLLMGGGVPPVT